MSYIKGLFGNLGAGKSSWALLESLRMRGRNRWTPICSTVPFILPGHPYTFFPAQGIHHYLVFSMEASIFARSPIAAATNEKISVLIKRRLGFLPKFDDASLVAAFKAMQERYWKQSESFDWRDRHALQDFIDQHNYKVLTNSLDSNFLDAALLAAASRREFHQTVDLMLEETEKLKQEGKDYLFKYTPAQAPFLLFIDEAGVAAASTDNKELRASSFYHLIAQLRKFGGLVLYATHEPMLIFKQMRDVTDLFCMLRSYNTAWGRAYLIVGHRSPEAWEAGNKVRYVDVGFLTWRNMSRYPTFWIVTTPKGLN